MNRRGLFVCCCVLTLAIAITGAAMVVYVARVLYIREYGVELKPAREHEVIEVQYYLQNDPEWSSDIIGGSNRKMGSTGCLIACVASAITDLGVPVTPGEVNQKLTEAGGFQDADLIWYKINEAFPEISYTYSRVFSSAMIEKDLESGLLPIVNVRLNRTGITHWLLIIGGKDGEFLAYDPLDASKEPINLSRHGNVYSYRVLMHADMP